jgi:hypothetical protein
VPTLGRLREGAIGWAADAQGSGVFIPPRLVVATAFATAALVIIWFEVFWQYCM